MMISGLREIQIPRRAPLLFLIVTSIIAIGVSFFSLNAGWTTIFQNLFYFPIIIACAFYYIRGFYFSLLLSIFYLACIAGYTRDIDLFIGALIRVAIFILVAGTVTYLSLSRKSASDNLELSEAKYRSLFNNAILGIFRSTPQGKYVEMNPAFAAIYGYDSPQSMMSDIQDIQQQLYIRPEDRQRFRDDLASKGELHKFEVENRHKTGNIIWISIHAKAVQDTNGDILFYEGTIEDITARKTAEIELARKNEELYTALEQLSSSEEELKTQLEEIYSAQEEINEREITYRQLFENNIAGIALHEIICDPSGIPTDYRFIEINPVYRELTGFAATNTLGKTVHEILPDIEPFWIETYGKVALSGKTIHFEHFSKELDKYFEITAYSPKKGQFATIVQDITERKKSEEQLKETNAYLDNLISNANVPIMVWDPDLHITRVNQSFEILTGWNATEIIGKSLKKLFPPDQMRHSMRLIQTTQDGVRWDTLELPILHRDGEIKTVIWNSSTIYNDEGVPVATIAQGRDITYENALELEKEQLANQIQQNIAKLAILNDGIRNPLTIIATLADLSLNPELQDQIQIQISRIDDMINSLDREWIHSEKILDYLRKHHHIHKEILHEGLERERKRHSDLKQRPHCVSKTVIQEKSLLIEEVQAQLYTILDSIDAIIYVSDMETYELLYINKKARSVFGDYAGHTCHQWLMQGQESPCDFCTNKYLIEDKVPTGVYRWESYNPSNKRWYDCRDRAIRWTDGKLVRLEIASDITDEKQIDNARDYLLQSDYLQYGEDFFQSLVRYLGKNLGATYVSVDILSGGSIAQTLAAYYQGILSDTGSFSIKDTVISQAIGKNFFVTLNTVRREFPNDILLQEIEAESYLGATVWSYSRAPIGLISVVWRKTPENLHLAESLLKMAAIRVAGEIERTRTEIQLKENETRVQEKLSALLDPEGDIGTLDLDQIIDSHELQQLMDEFYAVTHIGVGILDIHGKVLVGTGWQDICTKFHRIHPETCAYCIESDINLAKGVTPGTFRLYRCKNNMWDIATPIIIGKSHLGNLFLGQFFFDDENIDTEFFRKQAQLYEFDEEAYITALLKVPRWSKETVDHVMHFYTRLIHLISKESWSAIRLARAVTERDRLINVATQKDEELSQQFEELQQAHEDLIDTEYSLKKSMERFKDLVETSPDIIFELNTSGCFQYISQRVWDIFGYTPEELKDKPLLNLIPEKAQNFFVHEINEFTKSGDENTSIVIPGRQKNGTCLTIEIRFSQIRNSEGTLFGMRGIIHDITKIVHIEEELKRSEEKFRHIFEDAIIGIFQTTPDGVLVTANDALAKMFGYPNGTEMVHARLRIGQDLYFHPEDRFTLLKELDSDTLVYLKEIPLMKRNGTMFLGSINARCITDDDGRVLMYEGTILDVTDHRRIENAIATSEDRFQKILNLVPDMISIHGPDMNILYSNWKGFGEVSPERRCINSKCYTTYRGLKTVCPDCQAIKVLQTKLPIEAEVQLPEGNWIDLRVIPLLDEKGEVSLFMEWVRDITEKKLAEEELREERQRLASIIAGTRAGTWEWNIRTGEIFINSIWAEILGYSKEELLPTTYETWKQLTHPDDLKKTELIIEQHFAKKIPYYDAEFRMLHKDGHYINIHDRGQVMTWTEDQKPLMMYGTHLDITEQKKAEQALFEANKKLNLLSDITRHDIRNSLSGLLLYLDKTRSTPLVPEAQEYTQKIEQITDLIQKAIEFTHDYQNIGVKQAIWQNIEVLFAEASHKVCSEAVSIHTDIKDIEIFADPLLVRAVYNIIDNALTYGGPNITYIRSYVTKTTESLSWFIEDNGVGIPDIEKTQLFDHGFGKNTGFGLFFTREILAITGINILENGRFGEGARFEIQIPTGKWRMRIEGE